MREMLSGSTHGAAVGYCRGKEILHVFHSGKILSGC